MYVRDGKTLLPEDLGQVIRNVGANVSGAKDDLVDRIVAHVAAGRDIRREPEPPPPIQEPRRLDEERFGLLFARLRGYELVAVLGEFDLRRSGAKDTQVRALWEARRSEETLLAALGSADLEGLLRRLELKTSGSKADRIQRLIEHFETTTASTLRASAAPPSESADETSEPAS